MNKTLYLLDKILKNMALLSKDQKYKWNFENIGGTLRVKITSGEEIAHLNELDTKMWTVLSCPVKGLEIDEKSLSYIDCFYRANIHIKTETPPLWLNKKGLVAKLTTNPYAVLLQKVLRMQSPPRGENPCPTTYSQPSPRACRPWQPMC